MASDPLEPHRKLWEEPRRYLLEVPDRLPPGAPGDAADWCVIIDAAKLCLLLVECSGEEWRELRRRMRAAGVRVLTQSELEAERAIVDGSPESPLQVCASEHSSAHHVRLSDGRFQLVSAGPSRPIHGGFEHILVVEPLALLLAQYAADDIAVIDAVVYDPASKTESRVYKEIVPRHELTVQSLFERRHPDARAWHFRREALFLAAPVPQAIAEYPGLQFHQGFSGYAGIY